jgi:hypothetical protein
VQIRILAPLAAMLIILGSGTAYAGDTVLFTPMLSPPVGGTLKCHVTNVGKKVLPYVELTVMNNSSSAIQGCGDLSSASLSTLNHTCSSGTATAASLCRVIITGGSRKSVRAVLNVVDSSGATILSVPATK